MSQENRQTDIVERLSFAATDAVYGGDCADAIEEIKRLRVKVEEQGLIIAQRNAELSARWKEMEQLQLTIKGLRTGIAAAQAREAKLREALSGCAYWMTAMLPDAIQEALALPADDSVLKAVRKVERERCAKVCECINYPSREAIAIRALGDE